MSGSDVAKTDEWKHRVMPLIAAPDVHVAVEAIDRILRADAFNFQVMQDLLATSTRIYAPGKIHDLASPEDSFVAGLLALIGGREKADIKRKLMGGREAARRRGEWPLRNSALPRGITYDRKQKKWGYDEPEAAIIRSIYHQFVVQHRSMRAIGRDIGKPMQVVRQYIVNPIYKGILRWDERRGEEYPIRHERPRRKNARSPEKKRPHRRKVKRPPEEVIERRAFGRGCEHDQLVSDRIWAAAQRILQANSLESRRRRVEGRPETWASGFLVSALAPLGKLRKDGFIDLSLTDRTKHHVYANGGPLGQRRYSCNCGRGTSGLAPCGLRSPRAKAFNETLDAFLGGLTTEDWFVEAVQASVTNLRAEPDGRRAMLDGRLQAVDKREARLRRLYLGGRIDPANHDAEQDRLRGEREGIRVELAHLDAEAGLPTPDDLANLRAGWAWNPEWDHTRKREWLQKYVYRIAVSNEGIEHAVVRVPAGDGDMPVFGTGQRMDWVTPVWSRAAPRRNQRG